jgi:hypothetical protein
MEILRTIIRFLIITLAIGILVFLSVTLFKLIPKGINQLATATVAVTNGDRVVATTTATSTYPAQNNSNSDVYTTQGDIVIMEKPAVVKPAVTQAPATKVVRTQTPTYTYYPTQAPLPSGRKNLHVSLSSIGIISPNGVFSSANSFNTQDTVSVRFLVINEQDTPTGPWALKVDMPAIDAEDRVKILNNLESIPAESTYTVEARFSGIDLSRGTPSVQIYLDPYNQINESNEGDNTLTVPLRNVYQSQSTYYNNNNYNNYYNDYNNGYYNDNSYNNGYINNSSYNCSYPYTSQGTVNDYNYYNYCNSYNNTNGNGSTLPNLQVTSFETGRMVGGTFYPQTYVNYGERVAIRAHVRNNGGYFTNPWASKITAVDPYGYSRDFVPSSNAGLYSGSETTITYELDNLSRGSNRITFTADSQNNISESNEGDNSYQTFVQVN